MKKIFLVFAAVCTLFACDPTHEDIKNDGHITVDELKAMSSVTVDKAASGKNGNVITCKTSAPVNAKWTIDGKDFLSNYAKKKMKLGNYTIKLTALCPDGTELSADYQVSCEETTEKLEQIFIYGKDPATQPAFVLPSGDAGAGRFSDTEGKYMPYLSDEVYFGLKTLIFEITDVQPGPFIWGDGVSDVGVTVRIMTGWWDPVFSDNVPIEPKNGLWELPITQDMADWCAHSNKADAEGRSRSRDLTLLMTRGSVTIKSIYYEE